MIVWAGVMAFRGRAENPLSIAKRVLTAEFCVSQNSAVKPDCLRQGVLVPPLNAITPAPKESGLG